ncbi:hypothetical protein ACFQT0_18480 [Hymenobacter humi]|uniref:Uncharacterized protein n=1 Tax=Hymenobacter humi TaxID=1411620 RepID=A0ABW2U7P0_9BACT
MLFNETVQEAVAQLGKLTLADFRRLDKQIQAKRTEIEAAFTQTKEVAVAVLAENSATEADFFQGKRGIFGYVQKGTDLLASDAGPNSYVQTTLAEDKWYSGKIKTAADKARIDAVKEPCAAWWTCWRSCARATCPITCCWRLCSPTYSTPRC